MGRCVDLAGKKTLSNALKEVLKLVPEEKQVIGRGLVDELIFMVDVLTKLKSEIQKKGVVDVTENGVKESPAIRSYNAVLKNYSTLWKQLEMLLRKEDRAAMPSALNEFLAGKTK